MLAAAAAFWARSVPGPLSALSLEALEAEIPAALSLLSTQRAGHEATSEGGAPLAELTAHNREFMHFLGSIGLGHLRELFEKEMVRTCGAGQLSGVCSGGSLFRSPLTSWPRWATRS